LIESHGASIRTEHNPWADKLPGVPVEFEAAGKLVRQVFVLRGEEDFVVGP
jgi:hypothetical protein